MKRGVQVNLKKQIAITKGKRRGFNLIELVTVILIIAILVAAVFLGGSLCH